MTTLVSFVDRLKIEGRLSLELKTKMDMRGRNLIQYIFVQCVLSSVAFKFQQIKPVAVAECRARLLTVREVSRSNPSNLPLLQTWHVGNVTSCHAVYTLIQCTPLLVEKAGVTPDVTFGITACKQERVQARYPLWI